jgi:hypothetical protein
MLQTGSLTSRNDGLSASLPSFDVSQRFDRRAGVKARAAPAKRLGLDAGPAIERTIATPKEAQPLRQQQP